MSEVEPHEPHGREVAPRHIPSVVVPVPLGGAREFLRAAMTGTTFLNPIAQVIAGWAFFEPHVRFTAVDDEHTRIELDVTGRVHGAEVLLYPQRRGEIDRFFVAIQDELDRRERWRPQPPALPVDETRLTSGGPDEVGS